MLVLNGRTVWFRRGSSGRGVVVCGREAGEERPLAFDLSEGGTGATVDVLVPERLAGLRVVEDSAVAERWLASLEDPADMGFHVGKAEEHLLPLLGHPGFLCHVAYSV
jgi:hypothetical protein